MSVAPTLPDDEPSETSRIDPGTNRAWIGPTVLLVVLLAIWEAVARFDIVGDLLLASPTEIVGASTVLVRRGYFYEHMWATVRVIGFGFVLAATSATFVAIAISLSSFTRRGVYPVVVAADVVPKITLVPLLIVTLGFGQQARIMVVLLAAFFPVFLATLTALMNVDREGTQLLRSLGSTRIQHLRYHQLPAGLPAIFAGLKISLTVSFIAGILSELFVRQDGLGYLITLFRSTLNIDYVFAVTIAVGVLGMAIFFATERLERRVVFWRDVDDTSDVTPL